MKSIGIIGGSGVYSPEFIENTEETSVKTDFGEILLTRGISNGRGVYFLARHGKYHTIPPHKVNYRGNIMAFHMLGVERVIATAAVGSINKNLPPGIFVILDQFLDFTKSRVETFFSKEKVVHTDCTNPYCPEISSIIKNAVAHFGYQYHLGGTYVAVEGPRFETKAEIKAYDILGGDVVGMTGVPEVVLARELGMCYATIAIVTNYAAGISDEMLSHQEVIEKMGEMSGKIRNILKEVIPKIPDERHCNCGKVVNKPLDISELDN